MSATEIVQRHMEGARRRTTETKQSTERNTKLLRTGRLAGERFRSLGLPEQCRTNVGGKTIHAELLDEYELNSALRIRTAIDTFAFSEVDPRRAEDVQTTPRPARFLDLVEIVPVGAALVAPISESVPDTFVGADVDGLAEFQAMADDSFDGVFTADRLQLHRFGVASPVANFVLEDTGSVVATTIDRLFSKWFRLALEISVLRNPDTELEKGLLLNDGVLSVAYTTGTRAEAIGAVADAIGDLGFDGGISVAARPSTLGRIFREVAGGSEDFLRVREALPQVTSWVPTIGLAAGAALVGDFSEVVVYAHGLDLELARAHKDYFTRGLTSVKLESRCNHWVRQPAAFQVLTGL